MNERLDDIMARVGIRKGISIRNFPRTLASALRMRDALLWALDGCRTQAEYRCRVRQIVEPTEDGIIYIMISTRTGLHKIGFTRDIDRRLQNIRLGDPSIEIVKSYPGSMRLEREIHEIFFRQHVEREWFRLGEKELAEIDRVFAH